MPAYTSRCSVAQQYFCRWIGGHRGPLSTLGMGCIAPFGGSAGPNTRRSHPGCCAARLRRIRQLKISSFHVRPSPCTLAIRRPPLRRPGAVPMFAAAPIRSCRLSAVSRQRAYHL